VVEQLQTAAFEARRRKAGRRAHHGADPEGKVVVRQRDAALVVLFEVAEASVWDYDALKHEISAAEDAGTDFAVCM